METVDIIFSVANIDGSLTSLTSIDEAFQDNQTLSSLQQTNDVTLDQSVVAKNPLIVFSNSGSDISDIHLTLKHVKKPKSSIPSLTCLEDVYNRIEKFLDSENLFITSPVAHPHAKETTLKPCAKIERIASCASRSRASTQESDTIEQSLPDKEFDKVAVPSFLAKRAGIQRSMSGVTLCSSAPKASIICLNGEAPQIHKSNFAKIISAPCNKIIQVDSAH